MKSQLRLMILAFSLAASLCLIEATKFTAPKEYSDLMREAATKTEMAFQAVKTEKLARGYRLSVVDDPNQTGLIGDPFTTITTTLGNLEAKRSTTNPNVSAMLVDMFHQLDLKPGDRVAVNLSSSFPAINIAVLCAMDVMQLDGIIINSIGASTYGANLPDFTYLDMENLLTSQKILKNHTTYFSMGGLDDLGKEMPEEIKAPIISRLSSMGYEFLSYPELEENLDARYQIYQNSGPISCFINAGGNLLSFGGGEEMTLTENGIIRNFPTNKKAIGLIPMFLNDGIPSIHLLNMKSLLPAYGLPVDPIPLPPAGEGAIYTQENYSKLLSILLLVVNAGLMFWLLKDLPKKKIPL